MSAKRPPADVVAENKNPLICHIVCVHIQPCWGEEFCSCTIYTLHENHHALHTKKKLCSYYKHASNHLLSATPRIAECMVKGVVCAAL